VVDAANARAHAGDVRAVDVHRDRDAGAAVADLVDVAWRGEPADRAGPVLVARDHVEAAAAEGEDLLVFGTLEDGGDAPGQVVVDRGRLARAPHHDHDGERTVFFGVHQVALVARGVT